MSLSLSLLYLSTTCHTPCSRGRAEQKRIHRATFAFFSFVTPQILEPWSWSLQRCLGLYFASTHIWVWPRRTSSGTQSDTVPALRSMCVSSTILLFGHSHGERRGRGRRRSRLRFPACVVTGLVFLHIVCRSTPTTTTQHDGTPIATRTIVVCRLSLSIAVSLYQKLPLVVK